MSAPALGLLAAAKVNLALHVTGRRTDGYHLLDSIAVFAAIGDRIAIESATGEGIALKVSGPFASAAPGDASDLAFRAAAAFFEHIGGRRGVSISVEKNIPAGTGLGGGSADAAAVLLALNRHFNAGLAPEDLRAIGLKLGADVPMCLVGKALRARGIGEHIAPLSGWPALPLVLVWPSRPVSTAEAFKALARRENRPLAEPPRFKSASDAAAWLKECRNDLEAPALAMAPQIGDVLSALRATEGCMLARMSGSGSACFGVYAERGAADAAAAVLKRGRDGWWIAATEAR